MRRRWKAAAGAVALAVAVALGGLSPAVSEAEPVAAAKDFSKPAIVILGYGLNPDGTMRAILRRRVLTGLTVAQFYPQSPIIVTGGNPQNGAYLRFPFEAMLAVVAQESVAHRAIVVGEDLGTVPENLRAALADWGIWSYRVMLFERERKRLCHGRHHRQTFADGCAAGSGQMVNQPQDRAVIGNGFGRLHESTLRPGRMPRSFQAANNVRSKSRAKAA